MMYLYRRINCMVPPFLTTAFHMAAFSLKQPPCPSQALALASSFILATESTPSPTRGEDALVHADSDGEEGGYHEWPAEGLKSTNLEQRFTRSPTLPGLLVAKEVHKALPMVLTKGFHDKKAS
ncbi:hypothetical protein GOP47_0009088 [Adiantum capillus-veneris]|uniref:Uncharacterized protein n=1 Tax=Adiantum capillus-veneris TaxID=13818 RepID=A0A9D4UZS4_ADICA|nr:hypothetical protein GOP47_0009088 [Adiantum capillus-veneris]